MTADNSFPSPDGRYVLEICGVPMLMSHEVDSPSLYEAQSRNCLFDPGSLWDASGVSWSEDSRHLTMNLRHYPNGTQSLLLSLDLETSEAVLSFEDQTVFAGAFANVAKSMETVSNVNSVLAARKKAYL